jgi:hypothetical protein
LDYLDFAIELPSQQLVNVSVELNSARTELSIRFGHFFGHLQYDPNVGVLISGDGNGDGGFNVALICCEEMLIIFNHALIQEMEVTKK